MKKNILIFGSSGYVGNILSRHLMDKYDVRNSNINDCDLREKKDVENLAKKYSPDVIIHAAGNKDIKSCEDNPKKAYAANELSVKNIVDVFTDKKIIYISTDYVFDGGKGMCNEEDMPDPQTVYGKSKLAGEKNGLEKSDNFIVLRSSAIFDAKASFLAFLNKELANGREVECFHDTFYSPTYYEDLLAAIQKIIDSKEIKNGIYHCCGERISRYAFAETYAEIFGFNKKLIMGARASSNFWFLFSDLSMDNKKISRNLGVKATPLKDSLIKIRNQHENNQTI
jgi:dTDP-4-dehydrorhamnose reductase